MTKYRNKIPQISYVCIINAVIFLILRQEYIICIPNHSVDLGGLVVSVLATGPKFRGFDPDRGRWIF
jgi:hypothetical protein